MADHEAPYDPPFTRGQNAEAGGGDQRTQALQGQINETVGAMQANMHKMNQRGERLDSLQDKTDNLATSAQGFRRGANRVRKQMWLKDMRMRICLIVGIIVLILIIALPAALIHH